MAIGRLDILGLHMGALEMDHVEALRQPDEILEIGECPSTARKRRIDRAAMDANRAVSSRGSAPGGGAYLLPAPPRLFSRSQRPSAGSLTLSQSFSR